MSAITTLTMPFHPSGQRDAETDGTTGGAFETNAGEPNRRMCFQLFMMWIWSKRECRVPGVCEAHRQGLCGRQAGGGRGDVPEPVQAPPDGRGVRLG